MWLLLPPCLQAIDLRKAADRNKKDYVSIKMYAEEETILLRQQMVALRQALRDSDKECQEVKKELEREVWRTQYAWKLDGSQLCNVTSKRKLMSRHWTNARLKKQFGGFLTSNL